MWENQKPQAFQFNSNAQYLPSQQAMAFNQPKDFMGNNVNQSIPSNMDKFNMKTQDIGNEALAFGGGGYVTPNQDGSAFGMPSMSQIGAGVGIAKDLFGMHNAYKGMGLAKQSLANQQAAYQDNKANRDRFVNNTQAAFA